MHFSRAPVSFRPNSGHGKILFNEAIRVQMPAFIHLAWLGYDYFGKIIEDMAGINYDPDTNTLTEVFKKQFVTLYQSMRQIRHPFPSYGALG